MGYKNGFDDANVTPKDITPSITTFESDFATTQPKYSYIHMLLHSKF